MPDMLVKLYNLPGLEVAIARQQAQGITIRRALAAEKRSLLTWVKRHWGEAWESECDVAFARQPVACVLAVRDERILGFACHEATCRGFFGPTGVRESAQGQGTGTALLLAALHAMRAQGYAYAIIGGAGEDAAGFYTKIVGAIPIAGSTPGIYGDKF